MDLRNEFVKCEIDENIAVVTIDRPPVNALNMQVLKELQTIFGNLAKEPKVLVVIITGGGKKVFVAGADIDGLRKHTPETGKQMNSQFQNTFSMIADFIRPVICAVSGLAIGGGSELALACDLIIADTSAVFSWPEVNLGLIPAGGGTQRLPRQIPVVKAKELIFTGRKMKAEEAEKVGLVNQVVPEGEVLTAAKLMAKQIVRRGPVAVAVAKKCINEGMGLPIKEGLHIEAELSATCFGTADFKEGVNAFFAKRTPKFEGQ